MEQKKDGIYVNKWVMGILGGILVSIVLGGSTLLLQVDKAQSLQDLRLQTITKELSQIGDKMEPIVDDNAGKIRDLENAVEGMEDKVVDVQASVKDLDALIREVGRNLENRIKNPGNP